MMIHKYLIEAYWYIDGLSKIGILEGYKEDNTLSSNNNIKRV